MTSWPSSSSLLALKRSFCYKHFRCFRANLPRDCPLKKSNKRLIPFVFAILLIGFHVAGCSKTLAAHYPKMGLTLFGNQPLLRSAKYSSLTFQDYRPDAPWPPSHVAFCYRGGSYPLTSMTLATLDSLGCSTVSKHGSILRTVRERRARATFIFMDGKMIFVSYQSATQSSPMGFICGIHPELRLPLSQKQMETQFGKPDRIRQSRVYREVGDEVFNSILEALIPEQFP